MAFPRIEIYPRAREPLSGDEDLVISQGGVLRKTSTDSIAALATSSGGDGTTTFGGTPSTLAVGTPVGVGASGGLVACRASDGMSMPSFVGFLLDPATNKVQTQSLFTTSGLTAGASYFIGNAGGITTTPPTTSGYAVQRIGAAYSTPRLYVQPVLIVITDGA
jgi:hypothetical protein